MSCVVAAASELIVPECVLIVAATIAATMRPSRPGGMRSTMNVGKIWSAAGNSRPPYSTHSPDADHEEERELREHDEAAADQRALRIAAATATRAAAAR